MTVPGATASSPPPVKGTPPATNRRTDQAPHDRAEPGQERPAEVLFVTASTTCEVSLPRTLANTVAFRLPRGQTLPQPQRGWMV